MRRLSLLLLALFGCTDAEPSSTAHTAALEALPGVAEVPAVTGLSAESRIALEGAPMSRVLVLPERFAAESFITSGPAWYAISYQHEGLNVSLHVTDRVHAELDPQELERIPVPTTEVRGVPARTTLNEQVRAVTWTEPAGNNGVAFSLEVECYEAFTDTRCTDPYWAFDLADELVEVRR